MPKTPPKRQNDITTAEPAGAGAGDLLGLSGGTANQALTENALDHQTFYV